MVVVYGAVSGKKSAQHRGEGNSMLIARDLMAGPIERPGAVCHHFDNVKKK